ncbi:hypothetical protein GCM10025879_06550 [Leuconostoc litchii]|nr:hypothetical protein GCM10025879_06550 [Leuconostoc litchii]
MGKVGRVLNLGNDHDIRDLKRELGDAFELVKADYVLDNSLAKVEKNLVIRITLINQQQKILKIISLNKLNKLFRKKKTLKLLLNLKRKREQSTIKTRENQIGQKKW